MVGTLTIQILWVYAGLHGSMQLYGGLHGGLHGSTWGTFFKGWWRKNQDFMLVRLFNPNDLIDCGGDINQSDSLDLCWSMQVYGGLHGGLCGSMQICTGDFFKGWWGKNQDFMLIRLFNCNDLIIWVYTGLHRSTQVYVALHHCLFLLTIDLVGDNRELEV